MTTNASTAKAGLTGWMRIFLTLGLFLFAFGPAQAAGSAEEIKRCRSVIAEAALVIELWSKGAVTDIFTRGLLQTAEEQLAPSAANPDLDAAIRAELESASSAIKARDAGMLNRIVNELREREAG
jgi:hypothetical protein